MSGNIERCHGCGGMGWVETKKGAQQCPICYGYGKIIETDGHDYIKNLRKF